MTRLRVDRWARLIVMPHVQHEKYQDAHRPQGSGNSLAGHFRLLPHPIGSGIRSTNAGRLLA
jgi:hypothetical protein